MAFDVGNIDQTQKQSDDAAKKQQESLEKLKQQRTLSSDPTAMIRNSAEKGEGTIERIGNVAQKGVKGLGKLAENVTDAIFGTKAFTPLKMYDVQGLEGTGTMDLANQMKAQGDMSEEEMLAQKMHNVRQGEKLGASLDAQRGESIGQIDPSVRDALAARAKRDYESNLNLMERKKQLQIPYEQARMQMRNLKIQRGISDLQIKRADFYRQQLENRRSMRNNLISSLFGGVGAAAGGIVGGIYGGAGGAAAGSKIGGGVSQAITPAQGYETGGSPEMPGTSYQPQESYGIGGY